MQNIESKVRHTPQGSLNGIIEMDRHDGTKLTLHLDVSERCTSTEKTQVLDAIRILSNYIGYDAQILK